MAPDFIVSDEVMQDIVRWAKENGKQVKNGWIAQTGKLFVVADEPLMVLQDEHRVINSNSIDERLREAGITTGSEARTPVRVSLERE